MSTLAVARKDFLEVRRTRVVWFVLGLYAFFTVLMMYLGQRGTTEPDVEMAFRNLMGVGALVIPLVALVTAYLAIAGERESGTIKYLLSIPNDRRDVVLGKYLSRAALVGGSILGSFGLAAILAVAWYPSVAPATLVGVTLLTLLYALSYVSVAVGISAAASSRVRAIGAVIGFFLVTNVFNLFGEFSIVGALDYVANDLFGLGLTQDALTFVQAATSPTWTYTTSMRLVMPDRISGVTGAVPWFLRGEVMVVVLLAWLVVPVALGVWWFDRADLG